MVRKIAHKHELSAGTTINEFQRYITICSWQVPIGPQFVGRIRSEAVPEYGVRRTIDNVYVSAVSFPSGHACGEVFVGVGDSPVVLFLERIPSAAGLGGDLRGLGE